MSITTTTTEIEVVTTHPPQRLALAAVLPRLGLVDRIALRLVVRALTRLSAEPDRESRARQHRLVLDNERRREEALRAVLLERAFR